MRLLVLCFFLLGVVAGARAAPALEGTWSARVEGQPLVVVFAPGGTGSVDGAPMRWQTMGQVLFIEQDGEVGTYQFRLQNDQLQVSGGDFAGVVAFVRGNKAVASAVSAKAMQAAPAGGVARELVGKWCKGGTFSASAGGGSSSTSCFELKADGTYTYAHEGSMSAYAPGMWGGTASQSSDAGRWSVSGNRLTARSNGGTVSHYAFEKRNHPGNRDPMLCLDGDCYTTYWQKAPW